jgi:5-methylcytosine-specific restriction endonuclease McrA
MIGFYSFGVDFIDGKIALFNQSGNGISIDACDEIIDLLNKYKENFSDHIPSNKRYVSKLKRAIIFKMQGDNCLCCGKLRDVGIDHILPISHGGDNNIDNLQVLCRTCNSKKGKHNIIDYRKNLDLL